ncbi:MAG: LamG-like jellyroll fold domain-containing protein [bacterium]|nr:LamG-like jellyroll fold domain-containing protein [bacterium]
MKTNLKYLSIALIPFFLLGCAAPKEDEVATADLPTVSSTTPANGDASVAANSTLKVTFDQTMSSSSITTNDGSADCTGVIQLSSDDFVTCVPLNSTLSESSDQLSYTATPSSNLSAATTYKLKVTTGAQGSNGATMAANDTMADGFIVASAPTVSYDRVDGVTGVSASSAVTATFSKAMDTTSLTANSSAGTCTGSVQISADSFTNCLALSLALSTDKKVLVITPSGAASGTTYNLKITTTAAATDATSLASASTLSYTTQALTASGLSVTSNAKAVALSPTKFLRNSTASTFGVSNTFSISTWVKPTSYPSVQGYILFMTPTANYEEGAIEIRYQSGGNFRYAVHGQSTGSLAHESLTSSSYATGSVYHLVLTWDGSTKSLKFYVNGSLASATPVSSSFSGNQTDGNEYLTVGNYNGAISSYNFTGNVNSLALWGSVLSASEVTALYSSGSATADLSVDGGNYSSSANLKHWWKFGTDSANIGKDYLGSIDLSTGASGVSTSDIVDF